MNKAAVHVDVKHGEQQVAGLMYQAVQHQIMAQPK
jgi:hypothetical protein